MNGAGILRIGSTDTLSFTDWQACLAVNAGGAFNLFQQTLPVFRQQRAGAIVTIASNAAHAPRLGMSAYGASKAALRSLCQTVGLEMAPYGVRCNIVSPGSTDTDMQRSLWHTPEAEQEMINGFPDQYKLGIPLRKIAQPQEIVNNILFGLGSCQPRGAAGYCGRRWRNAGSLRHGNLETYGGSRHAESAGR